MKLLYWLHLVLACAGASAQTLVLPQDEALRSLLARSAALDARELDASLAALGPLAAGPCLRALAEGVAPTRRDSLHAFLCRHPEAWRYEASVAARGPLDLHARVALLGLVGELGTALDFGLVRSLGTWPEEGALPRALDNAVQSTLAVLLASDGAAWEALWRALGEWPDALRPALLMTVARNADARGLTLLAEHLEMRKGHRLLTLRAIGRCAADLPWPHDERVLAVVRRHLGHDQAAVRREAALAAAQLQDEEALPLLIALLESGHSGVAPQAGWALRRITGIPLRDEPGRWGAWLESESAWWRDEAPRLLEALGGRDAEGAVHALHQLAGRRYPRHALARELGEALLDADGEVTRLLAAALGQLGSPAGIQALEARLRQEDEHLRELLEQTLRGLRRQQTPPARG